MRIAMIGSRGIPAHAGGIERVVEELTAALADRGHEVIVYARRHYCGATSGGTAFQAVPSQAQEAQAGKPVPQVIFTPGLSGKHLDAITHTATAAADVLRRGVDVVHFHAAGPALMSWLPVMAHLPVVLTVHAPDWRRDKWSLPARLSIRAGLHIGMGVAAAVTAVSQPLAKELSLLYNRSIAYIPNAPPSLLTASKASPRGEQESSYALYVGRIVPEKRLELLLEAWSMAAASCPLLIAGDYGESPYGRQCLQKAGPNVRFLGPRYGRDLADLYARAALVVQPSSLEGMSLVLLEAASHGRCILAARTEENVAAMGENIVYFLQDSVTELSSQISRCLEDEAFRDDYGQRAKAFVERSYCWPAIADQYEAVYRQASQRSEK